MTRPLASPTVRLAARALLAGVAVGVTSVQTSGSLDSSTVKAALVCGGWAALEAFTPLNTLVGKFKGPTTPAP